MSGKGDNYLPYGLENMSIPELEVLLQQDFIASNGSAPDIDYIMAIMEVIQKKEEAKPGYQPLDTEGAWEKFQSFYNTEEDRALSVHHVEKNEFQNEVPHNTECISNQKKPKLLRKRFIAVSLLAALLAATMLPVSGYANVLQMIIAYWTDDYFSFVPYRGNTSGNTQSQTLVVPIGFEKLWDFAQKKGIENLKIPWYIPEGFQAEDTTLNEFDLTDSFEFYVFYTRNDDHIGITITNSHETSGVVCEKDANNVEPFESNGTEYYIFNNNGENVSAIYYNGLEYIFRSTLPTIELKQIIDSMYKE